MFGKKNKTRKSDEETATQSHLVRGNPDRERRCLTGASAKMSCGNAWVTC